MNSTARCVGSAVSLVVFLACAPPSPPAPTVSDAGPPSPWSSLDIAPGLLPGNVAVIDDAHDRLIVFGGVGNDTWQLPLSAPAANIWSRLEVAGAPPPQRENTGALFFESKKQCYDSAVYDPDAGRMLVLLCDTSAIWELSLSGAPSWRLLTSVGAVPDWSMSMVLDRSAHRLFVLGDDGVTNIWALALTADSVSWAPFAGARKTTPLPDWNLGAPLLLDEAGQRLIILGGWHSGDFTVSLSTAKWAPLTGMTGPYRDGHETVLDPRSGRIIAVGVDEDEAQVGELVLSTGVFSTVSLSAPHAAESVVLDAKRNRVLYVAGAAVWALQLDTAVASPVGASGNLPLAGALGFDAKSNQLVALSAQPMTRGLQVGSPWQALPALPSAPFYSTFVGAYDATSGDQFLLDLNNAATVYRLSGGQWASLVMADGPVNLNGVVFDEARHRVEAVGLKGDVWTLSLEGTPAWVSLTLSGAAPSARYTAHVVYDSKQQRVLMAGGGDYQNGAVLSEVWALAAGDAPAWQQVAISALSSDPSGPLLETGGATATFDAAKNRLVLVALQTGDVYALELDSGAWHRFCAASAAPSGTQVTGAVVVGSRLLAVINGATWAFDLSAPYCE